MGKPSRDKGGRVERLLCALFRGWGLATKRVGVAGAHGHDVDLYVPERVLPYCVEVKARKDGFRELHKWLAKDGADMLALRSDNHEFIFVIPERVLRELLT